MVSPAIRFVGIATAVMVAACAKDRPHIQPPPQRDGGESKAAVISFDFEHEKIGALPRGWSTAATKPAEPQAIWRIASDATSSFGANVLALTSSTHGSRGTYNLCWTKETPFHNGQIELSFKAVSGEVDQGGGPIWRVQDANNYYIARANPLEKNFRVYYVKDGERKMLASAEVDVPTDQWHTINIKHDGDHIVCSLNGRQLLDVKDNTFPEAGGIGVWTKADAVTAFDHIVVRPTAATP